MAKEPEVIEEIESFLDEFVKAYPKDDIDRYLSLWAKDEDLVVYGTGEKWVGYEQYKPAPAEDRSRYDEIGMTLDWYKINYHGPIAWVATDVSVRLTIGEKKMSLPARGTMVLKKTGDEWIIQQAHISMPPEESND